MASTDATDEQTHDSGRRSFMRRAAIGGAAAGGMWVAPSILTLDAAQACGTALCTTGTTGMVWTPTPTGEFNPPGFTDGVQVLAPNPTQAGTGAGIRCVEITRSDPNNQNALGGGCWRIRLASENAWHFTPTPNSWFKERMGQPGLADSAVSTTLSFFQVNAGVCTATPQAVRDLTFSVLDIDSVGGPLLTNPAARPGDYRDRVFVNGVTTSGAFEYTVLFRGSNVLRMSGADAAPATSTTEFRAIDLVLDTSTADAGVARYDPSGTLSATNGAGNLRICVNRPVTSVTITHQRGTNDGGFALTGGQHIGIGNPTWCNVVP